MTVQIKINQGAGIGDINTSRDDIVAGDEVVIENVSPGASNAIALLWKSLDDDTAAFVPHENGWAITPKAGTWGRARFQVNVDGEELILTFTVKSPVLGLSDFAANERASDEASLQDMGPDKVALSETNQAFGPFSSGSPFGWWPVIRWIIEKLEALFNPSTGHTHDGTGENGPLVESLGDVSLLKIDDYQASFFETVRCHPGFGAGDSFVVTLPPTNGMADKGKWCRVLIDDTTDDKFVTVVGFGGPNAATIKKLGKKKIAYYKKVFQKYKKLKYFGDLINENSALDNPDLNLGNAFRLFGIEQDAILIWDGVQSWWIAETTGYGTTRGREGYVQDASQFDHFVDIHNKGIVGQSPPTRQIDPVTGLYGAELFAVNDQIYFSVPIHEYFRGHPVLNADPDLVLQLSFLNENIGGNITFELKVLGIREAGTNLTTAVPVTESRLLSGSATTPLPMAFFNIKNALDDGGLESNRATFLLMRLKCTILDGGVTGANLLAARLYYVPRFPKLFLFTESPKY